ncbi:MAG: histidinol phosphatase [Ruminococcaceae bacterium]|nr:histidinol phosphatase [Oscillospiraceae bacterium]
MNYKYELHLHTSESSKCGRVAAADMVKVYKDLGYTGIFVTDHFLNGNTTVPKDLPWKDRVDAFFAGYDNALAEGKKIGIDVFYGWEYCFGGTDFLTYGLSKQWLYDHPECVEISPKEYCKLVHESGGFIVHAHPFRESANAYSIDMIRLMPRDVDAVESFNSNMSDFQNDFASYYAKAYGLKELCGSDNHRGASAKRFASVCFNHRLADEKDFIECVKNGEYTCSHTEPLEEK